MGCFLSRRQEIQTGAPHEDASHSTARSNDHCIGIESADSTYGMRTFKKMVKSPVCITNTRGLGIQPRFRIDISSSSSSESEGLISSKARNRFSLVQKLGTARVNVQISSDDSSGNSSCLPDRIVFKKQNAPDPTFLSSKRENQSIDDARGDESVVDWLASESGSVKTTLLSEDDDTANSPIFAFQMSGADSPLPSQQITLRQLYVTADSMERVNDHRQHTVKNTERVERKHVDLPMNKPEAKMGDWLTHRYVINDYIILNEIGKGAFAEVRLCKNKNTNKLYAVKIMSRKAFDPNEVAIMKKLRHPNVLQLYEVLNDQRVNKIYLIIDYLKRGDLMGLVNSRGPLSCFEVWNVAKQVMCGLDYLHRNNIVHNDLKPSNILLGVIDHEMKCVIADFGIATPGRIRMDSAGTPSFMPPEVCSGETHDGRLADCYSLGATLYCIRIGRPPFVARGISKNQKLIDLHYQIKHNTLTFPIPVSTGLRDLITRLMEKDPTRRLNLQDAMRHRWLQSRPVDETD